MTKRLDGNTCNFNELTLHGGYHDNQDGSFTISGYRLLTSTTRTVREACPVSFQQATGSSLHQRKLEPLLPAPLAKFSSVQLLSCVQLFRLHRLKHARLLCPSPTPGACSRSCPLSRWCHPPTEFSWNSTWNSPGQNTGVGSCSLLQGIFPTQESNPGLPHCRRILYQLRHKGSPSYWSGEPIPSPANHPDPGIEPGSPVLLVDSLPTELSGKPPLTKSSTIPYV